MQPKEEKKYPDRSNVTGPRNGGNTETSKVMVATRETHLLERLSSALANLGLVVVQATDSDQAWRILRSPQPPDLAFIAWELSGLDLVRYCACELPDMGAPVIPAALILPKGGRPELTAGLLSGARGFVQRPVLIEEVLALTDTLLKLVRAENQNRELNSRIQAPSKLDPVTGALVWDHFFELSETEFGRSLRYHNPLSALMVQLCGTSSQPGLGRPLSLDKALRKVAAVLRSHLRESDILGRIGQHEFAATLPQTDLTGARELATRLKKALNGIRVDSGQGGLELKVNIGAAELDESCANMGTLLLRAEGAMTQAAVSDGPAGEAKWLSALVD